MQATRQLTDLQKKEIGGVSLLRYRNAGSAQNHCPAGDRERLRGSNCLSGKGGPSSTISAGWGAAKSQVRSVFRLRRPQVQASQTLNWPTMRLSSSARLFSFDALALTCELPRAVSPAESFTVAMAAVIASVVDSARPTWEATSAIPSETWAALSAISRVELD